jgi:hypothetical protein
MNKQLLLSFLILIFCVQAYSQITFENGYFIDESNNRIECLIRNNDWKNNPTQFIYKLTENDELQEASINTIKEFGIYDESKFIRKKVNIDKSSDFTNKLNIEKDPQFQEEVLFLKVIIEGEVSLFQYYGESVKRYFYQKKESDIKALVYKRYLDGFDILKNTDYKVELYKNLNCETIDISDLKRLSYSKNDLKKLIIKYHECINADYTNYDINPNKFKINLNIRPGINNSSFEIEDLSELRDTDFGSSISARFGFEAEFVLPTNKGKWALIIEPTYRSYESEKSKEANNVSGGTITSKIDYRSIELPIGARHYFYLSEKSKLFANISYVLDFDFDSKVEFLRADNSLISSIDIEKQNIAIGAGYKYNDKFGIEFRYFTNETILKGLDSSASNFNTISVIFGYTLF